MTGAELLKRVLYRDGLMLVVDKPAGIAVHAPPGGGQALENYFDALRYGLPRRPALAHRLDRATSGCLVLGRHPKALRRLGKLFESDQVKKTYWAVVGTKPLEPHGVMDFPLLKQEKPGHQWFMTVDSAGKPSLTEYTLLGEAEAGYWLELRPQTGRTHQLRVHCAQAGFPILGDPLYGDRNSTSQTSHLHLHARRIEIPLYPKRGAVMVESPPPPHMLKRLTPCGYFPSPPTENGLKSDND